jgi:hypothetical protein
MGTRKRMRVKQFNFMAPEIPWDFTFNLIRNKPVLKKNIILNGGLYALPQINKVFFFTEIA